MSRRISRSRMLRAAGVALGLPLPGLRNPAFAATVDRAPKRMVLISNNLGVLPDPFFPSSPGAGYELSPYLAHLSAFRDDFTVFSGLSHPDVEGGHSTENCFLTAAPGPTKSGFRNTISLDQFAAEHIGPVTRFPAFNLGVNIDQANRSLSWTRDGVLLPAEDSPSAVFRRMFLRGRPEDVQGQMDRIDQRASILDTLLEDTRLLRRQLDSEDRSRLDQYLTSVREVEQRLQVVREWERRQKPVPSRPEPTDIDDSRLFFRKLQLMLSMAQLAIESDSTRLVTLMVDAFATPVFQLHPDEQSLEGYHGLSHHGQHPDKLRQLRDADTQQMVLLRELIQGLAECTEDGERLLDRTLVLFGSNLGDANTHDNRNLPILLAGGGFRHGQHLAFSRDDNTPLCNLFVSMLQQCGIEADAFGSSTGTLNGLEPA